MYGVFAHSYLQGSSTYVQYSPKTTFAALNTITKQQMKRILVALSLSSVLFAACSKEEISINDNSREIRSTVIDRDGDDRGDGDPQGGICSEKTVDLIAGQNMTAGTVQVQQDAQAIYITYNANPGWTIAQTHLFVGDCAAVPVNGAGNPVPGRFPYKKAHNGVSSYTYVVPVSAIGLDNCGCIAAHAVLKQYNAAGNLISTQTGWGQGLAINPNGGNWGMKFDFCTINCQ
jgi:hypothetical protein